MKRGISVATGLDGEILGDWNNLKGTYYHFVYALWLLLRDQASQVAFYRGNDLFAKPIVPPSTQPLGDAPAIVPLRADCADKDVWVQLKSTLEPWTLSGLFKDNLLVNFICNALCSQRNSRSWETRLVTQATVGRAEVLEFVANPSRKPRLAARLNGVVKAVEARLRDSAISPIPDDLTIRNLALWVLTKLSEGQPTAMETLKAEIELELAYCYHNRRSVARQANMLLGAMLNDGAGGPAKARVYDLQWLNEIAGPGIKSSKPFDVDIVQACDQAVRRCLPVGWEPNCYMPRKHLETLFRGFIEAEEPVFVLLGSGGTGLGWPLANLMSTDLAKGVRFLVRGSELDLTDSLDTLAATTFAGLTNRELRDQDYLPQLVAAATASHGPLVIGVYDIRVSPNEADRIQRTLGRLAEKTQSLGAKLILACDNSTWELYRLGITIQRTMVFRPESHECSAVGAVGLVMCNAEEPCRDIGVKNPTRPYSYYLGDLTGDELNEVIRLRVPPNRQSAAQSQIRSFDQIAFRNPYVLDHYLTKYGSDLGLPDQVPVPADVDVLLDERIEEQVERAAGALVVDSNSVRSAFWDLARLLWDRRVTGMPGRDATRVLEKHFPSQGGDALRTFRQVGILTSRGRVEFSEEPLANHVFARHLSRTVDCEKVWQELRPEADRDVITAFVRMRTTSVLCAGALVRCDRRWIGAVSRGLATCSPTDPQIIAALVGLAKPEGDAFANIDACRALGLVAARAPQAWKWVAEMYMSGDTYEQVLAVYTMRAAMEWNPDAVCQLVEKRIRLERLRMGGSRLKSDKLQRRISDALDPLDGITDREAALAAKAVLVKCSRLITPIDHDEAGFPFRSFADALLDAIDDIRGRIAFYDDPDGIHDLLAELRSPQVVVRYRVAGALRPASFERPEQVQDGVCRAIRAEQSAHVLHRLLWMSARVYQIDPAAVINAIAFGDAAHWDNLLATAPALEVLGRAARTHAFKVREVLPERLDGMTADERAYVTEAHLYAWWNLAQKDKSAEHRLVALSQPDINGVSDEFQTFALRGAALAQLAMMSLQTLPTNEIEVKRFAFGRGGIPYMMLDTGDATEKRILEFVSNPSFPTLLTALVACVCEDNNHPVDVMKSDLRNIRFFVVRDCLDILVRFFAVMADPIPVLGRLPHEWQGLYVARNLLARKRQEEAIVAFARQECADRPKGLTVQAAHERERCLLELDRIAGAPSASLEANLISVRKPPIFSMFGGGGETRRLADVADRAPDRLLAIIDDLVTPPGDPSTLYDWHGASKSWQSALVARTYWRMFRPQKLRRLEATQLIDDMLTAVRSLQPSDCRDEYEAIYGALQDVFVGRVLRQMTVRAPAGLIRNSHALAVAILQHSIDAPRENAVGRQWLSRFLLDRSGWWETSSCVLQIDGISRGAGLYLIYFFPTVRLALAAVGNRFGIADPAGQFMIQRMSANRAIKDQEWLWLGGQTNRESLERGLSKLEGLASVMPLDERLWLVCGNLLLRLGRLAEAEDRLDRCLNLQSCDSEIGARAKYDFACVYAREGDEERCRAVLLDSDQLHPLDRSWLAQDSDFQVMRDRQWFQQLLVGAKNA